MQDIIIGCDHNGYEMKEQIKEFLRAKKLFFVDMGVASKEAPRDEDYPPIIKVIKEAMDCVTSAKHFCGIMVCGSGIGMSIACNRFKGVRAGLCHTPEEAKLARQHNDINVLLLRGYDYEIENIKKVITAFLNTKFQGDVLRYVKRRELFDKISCQPD